MIFQSHLLLCHEMMRIQSVICFGAAHTKTKKTISFTKWTGHRTNSYLALQEEIGIWGYSPLKETTAILKIHAVQQIMKLMILPHFQKAGNNYIPPAVIVTKTKASTQSRESKMTRRSMRMVIITASRRQRVLANWETFYHWMTMFLWYRQILTFGSSTIDEAQQ